MKLIKLQDKFILVSDEEIQEDDYFYEKGYHKGHCKKIESKTPDFSLLSEKDCKKIGFVDFEKLKQKVLNKYIAKLSKSGHYPEEIDKITERDWFGLWEGFQIAQSLNDEMFSLETILSDFYVYATNGEVCKHGVINEFIQSLQKTEWDVEVEMEYIPGLRREATPYSKNYIPKITNNSIKITKIL